MLRVGAIDEGERPSNPQMSTLAQHCVYFNQREIIGLTSFVGIHLDESNTHPWIYLPHGFPDVQTLSEAELRDAISTLLRVLSKDYRNNRYKDHKEQKDRITSGFPFDSYRYIIQDYQNFGYLKESERLESRHGCGRNDWRKTINKSPPLWTEQGAVHLFPIKVKTVRSHQYLMEIQKYCLSVSLRNLGWLYGIQPKKGFQTWSNVEMTKAINAIQTRRLSVFSERLTVLLKHLLIVLNFQSNLSPSDVQRNMAGAVNSMNVVWEHMVESVFGSGKHGNYQPTAVWKLASGEFFLKKPLELDTIRWDTNKLGNKICTVVDAKYYPPGRLPNTSDINKQITYAEWVRKQDDIQGPDQVQNIFILPASLSPSVAEYEGYATMGILEDETKPYHRIHAIRVDTLTLMKWFLVKNTSHAAEIVQLRE